MDTRTHASIEASCTHKAPGGIGGRGVREVEACGCGAGVGAGARGRGGGRREREEHCSSSAGRVMLAEFRCMEFFLRWWEADREDSKT